MKIPNREPDAIVRGFKYWYYPEFINTYNDRSIKKLLISNDKIYIDCINADYLLMNEHQDAWFNYNQRINNEIDNMLTGIDNEDN